MTSTPAPAVSIIVATRNRAAMLARLLESLDAAQSAAQVEAEILVADNGSTDETPAVLEAWVRRAAGRVHLQVAQPGKSRALNHGLRHARAPLFAFLDDDEHVTATWLREIVTFFATHPQYHAAVGRVLPPPDVTDPELLMRLACYRTIAFFDHGDGVCEEHALLGGNMVLRRDVFDAVGTFNEQLGPGAAGGCEDSDLGERVVGAGLRIGYMPNVVVYHAIDPARLTPEAHRSFQLVSARSRFEMDSQRAGRRALPRLLEASLAFVWWSLLRRTVRREHARGRMIRHAEILRLHRQRRRAARGT